jgi:hypothetical protein
MVEDPPIFGLLDPFRHFFVGVSLGHALPGRAREWRAARPQDRGRCEAPGDTPGLAHEGRIWTV